MEPQHVFNTLFGVIMLLIGWWHKRLETDIRDLKTNRNELHSSIINLELELVRDYVRKQEFEKSLDSFSKKLDRLESLEVLLANNYVTHTTFKSHIDDVLTKLDRIEQKLDKKVDK
jgi:hypothetical protein